MAQSTCRVGGRPRAPAMPTSTLDDKIDRRNALRALGICDLMQRNSVITAAFAFDVQPT